MVDPSPRGMPIALQRYWLIGKGALKIRWRMPHDFDRCVRNLRKYFPKNPEGLCNILHQKAVGAPPGKGHPGEHAIVASATVGSPGYEEAMALIAAMPQLGQYMWAGPLAPIGRPTGEPRRIRVFEHGALKNRTLPLPLDWREKTGPGHDGAITVGRILGITYGPDQHGQDYAWGWGDYLDEDIIPEAKKARHLMEVGVAGASIDPGGKVTVTVDPVGGVEHIMDFTIGGATLVSVPAFDAMRLYAITEDEDYDDDDMIMELIDGDEGDCGCGDSIVASTFAVNTQGWRGLPLAPRESVFDNDDAVKRIAAWAGVTAEGADVAKLKRAFLWHDPQLPETDPTSYRLPVGDVINGRLTLIYHAIYAAAALLSGAHGGLPSIDEADRSELRNVISEIYPEMATAFNDSSIRAPWDRSAEEGVQMAMADTGKKEPYGDVEYADPGYRDNKKRYPLDTEKHIRAAWAYINVAENAAFYDAKQLAAIKGRIKAAAKKHGIEITSDQESVTASMSEDGYPLFPPREWFDDPELEGKTKLHVTNKGRVYGHLALWNECHRDVTMRECVLAPKSEQGYAPFHLGDVITEEGDTLAVGKIVMDTRHADIRLGYSAAALHYDNTGDEIAVIRAGEDEFGIWVAGAVVPEATPRKVAKLRRSPLSGDWRREKGSLELTAALAVNAPAFPVYSMENEERLALVAAGTVIMDDEEMVEPFSMEPITALIASTVGKVLDERDDHEHRMARLRDIQEDDEILDRREREKRLAHLFAMDTTVPPAPPVPPPGSEAAVGTTDEAWLIQAQADARYSIIEPSPLQEVNPYPQQVAPAPPGVPTAPQAPAPPAAPGAASSAPAPPAAPVAPAPPALPR